MVFIAFCAEEDGRVGSRYYASKAPLFPIRDTVAMMNFDMVGRLRDDELGIAGNKSAGEFGDLLAAADARSPIKLRLGGPEYPNDSDHASFSEVGVPILYLCTGSHEDRHTPGDTADKINFAGLARSSTSARTSSTASWSSRVPGSSRSRGEAFRLDRTEVRREDFLHRSGRSARHETCGNFRPRR